MPCGAKGFSMAISVKGCHVPIGAESRRAKEFNLPQMTICARCIAKSATLVGFALAPFLALRF
jgi:hypothetical protein